MEALQETETGGMMLTNGLPKFEAAPYLNGQINMFYWPNMLQRVAQPMLACFEAGIVELLAAVNLIIFTV
jgi:hypothetical protein